jgi:hypothetical protein
MQLAHPSRLTHWIRKVNPQIAGLLQQRPDKANVTPIPGWDALTSFSRSCHATILR